MNGKYGKLPLVKVYVGLYQIRFGSEKESTDDKIKMWFWSKVLRCSIRRLHIGAQTGGVYLDKQYDEKVQKWKEIEKDVATNMDVISVIVKLTSDLLEKIIDFAKRQDCEKQFILEIAATTAKIYEENNDDGEDLLSDNFQIMRHNEESDYWRQAKFLWDIDPGKNDNKRKLYAVKYHIKNNLRINFSDKLLPFHVANKVVPVAWPSKPEERAFGGNRGRGGKRGGRGRGRGRGGRKRRGT